MTQSSGDEPNRDDVRRQALGGARWAVLDKWGTRLFAFASFALLAYLLSPEAFGVVAAAQVIIALVQTLTEQGIGATVIVQRRDDSSVRNTAFWMSLAAGGVGGLALWASAPVVARVMGAPELTTVLPVLGCYFVIRGIGIVPEALLQRRLQFKSLAIRTLSAAVSAGVVAVVLAFAGFGVWALVAQILVQALVATVMVWVAARFRVRFDFDPRVARVIFRFSWKVLLVDALTVGVTQGDKFLVGALLGPIALGYYTVAFRLFSVLVEAFTGVVSSMATPVFARLRDDRAYTARALSRVTGLSLAVSVPAFGALLVLAPFLIPLLFGAHWQPSVAVLQALCVGGMVSAVTFFDRGVLYAADRAGLEALGVGVIAVSTVVAATIGAQFGVVGVALGISIRMFATLPVRLGILKAAIHLSLRSYLWAWRGPAVGAILFAIAAGGLSMALTNVDPVVRVSLTAGVSILVYACGLFLVDRGLVKAGLRVMRKPS